MKKKILTCQILMLLMMSVNSLYKHNQNLNCYTDYLDVITCVWNTSLLEDRLQITSTTNCSLRGKYNDFNKIQTPQSILEPVGSSQPKLREATLRFLNTSLSLGDTTVLLFVFCDGKNEPVESFPDFDPIYYVKLYPPERPLVNGLNVTWQHGSPQSFLVSEVKYEVQWSLLENSWENTHVAITEEEHYELPEEMLTLGKEYVIRVRSIPVSGSEIWSEWSPVTQWTATVGLEAQHEYPNDSILDMFTNLSSLTVFVAVTVLLLPFICILRYRRIMKCPYVPTPRKYFGNLFSVHGGDFKAWLGPIVNPEMYLKADLECISPVTIYEACNSNMLLRKKIEKDVSIMDGNSSFTNSMYFLSQSSKCAIRDQLEPCSADSPYGPAAGGSVQETILSTTHDTGHENEIFEVSTPLETSSSYKQMQKLRLEIRSPDSGFAGSSEEQESQEEFGSEGLPSPPVVDSTLPISCILPCPVPQLIEFPHLGIPLGLAWNPLNNQIFTNMAHDITRNVLLGNSGIMSCSGIVEPSDDDYMPVKNVQG